MPTHGHVLCGCGRFMQVQKNGVTVEELFDDGSPYKLWDADRWRCPECGAEVVTGFAREPLAEAWQDGYQATRDRLAPLVAGRCAATPQTQFVDVLAFGKPARVVAVEPKPKEA